MRSITSRRGAFLLAAGLAVLATVFAACGSSGGEAPPSPGAQVTATPPGPTPTQSAAVTAGSGLVKGPFEGEAKTLSGAGATFPAVLYSKWFNEYEKVGGVKVNYQSIGSGGGIKSIQDQTVDFGATDGPMTDDQLKAAQGGEVLHIPMTLGAVVPTYNLPELGGTPLKLSPEAISGIFLGDITRWNDPKLATDNPGVNLPNKDIVVVHRSDGSGTSYIFTDYLSSVSTKWKDKVGTGTSVNWPVGLGGKGNEGVSGEVKQGAYTIGYVELIYALQNKLGVAQVKNRAGKYVEPNLAGVTAAAAGGAKNIPVDLRASIVNADGEDSYPISGFTWILAYQKQPDRPKAIALTRLLWWNIHDGQKYATALGYAPLPDDIVKRAEGKINSMSVDGQKAFPGK